MTIFELISTEAAGERRRLLVAASVAGAANAIILGLVNAVAAAPETAGLRLFAIFVLAVGLYILGARHTFHRTTSIIESALHRIRVRIVTKIERADFQQMERIGTSEIMDRLTENISVISDAAGPVANFLSSACILVFATIYLAWNSLAAFALLALLITGGVILFRAKSAEVETYLRQTAQVRLTFYDLVTDLLKGFKEVKFSRRRGRELREDIVRGSASLRAITEKSHHLLDENSVFANCILFVALGALVFVLPQRVDLDASKLTALVAGVMFSWSAIGGLVMGYPVYLRSNQAIFQIQALEAKLDAGTREEPSAGSADAPWPGRSATIEVRDVDYVYPSDGANGTFRIGPISLTIPAGEVLFIVGGNGSGKSTFLKVLTGLYPPTAGTLRVGGTLVDRRNAASYREMISAIYSDFHLFTKLYGLLGVEAESVRRLLVQMQIEDKTSFAGQRFTNRNLSTGQRKRLAMIVTLLEDRPICVLDEWAADQDPEFRKYFYEELIPELKRRGKTVIAVSHDDRYFRCADRVVTMEYGKIRSIERTSAGGAAQVDAGPSV
jgi:putative ATP-binding cassette transporter